MIVCCTNDNAFRERLLRESDLTPSTAISAGHVAEETQKHAREILQFQSTANLHKINKLHKPHHRVPNEKSKEIIKKRKFCSGQKFVETISIQDSLNINEIKNGSSVWSITFTSTMDFQFRIKLILAHNVT